MHSHADNGTAVLDRQWPVEPSWEFSPVPPRSDLVTRLESDSGLPFVEFERDTGTVLANGSTELLPYAPPAVVEALADLRGPTVWRTSADVLHYALPLAPDEPNDERVAFGYVLRRPGARPRDLVLLAAEHGWDNERLDAWLAALPVCSTTLLERLLALVADRNAGPVEEVELQAEIAALGVQIDQTYEQISLLHDLTRNLHISRRPWEIARLALERMHELIGSAGNAVWITDRGRDQQFLVEGKVPFDELGLAQLLARFDEYDWQRPLVRNHVERTLLGADLPGLRNFVAVPIAEGVNRAGWIVSCNLGGGREYGTVEASLLASVATILGTHCRNIDLYEQHEELLVSFVESLVFTLDAKDSYTRGHSERVALIARRLGEELELPESDLEDLYLAGILHDIGKIGVDDRILLKPGRLTEEEFDAIKEHPVIGYNILYGLKNLRRVLPGVRSHHESWDGSGYPDGLRGREIPLMARILAVADAYDAMGSDRPYREGMPLEKLESIFQNGAGSQWDAEIIAAYFATRDDVRVICERFAPTTADVRQRRPPGTAT